MQQALMLPKSSSSIVYEQLGYIDSFDAVVDKLYALLIYKETRTDNGKWVVRIKSAVTAGSAFDPDNRSLENSIRKAMAHKEEYIVWGFNVTPKENDPRLVESRLFFDDEDEPTRIEVHLITRDPDGTALPEVVTSVDWPGAVSERTTADGDVDDAFKTFYAEYEKACCEKNSDFIKALLPGDIPADEFAFVLDMSQQSARALKASGVEPVFSQDGNRVDVTYKGDLGDGMTEMVLDFYESKDTWLKYNPET